MNFSEFCDFTSSLSAWASRLLLNTSCNSLSRWAKKDGTIVTDLDITIEEKFRKEISLKYPTHSIHGEELSNLEKESDYCWVLDPLDGTFNYSLGVPFYGVLIGLLHKGKPNFGSCRLPEYENAFIAGNGQNCTINGQNLKDLNIPRLHTSLVLTTDESRILTSKYARSWSELQKCGSTFRTWGDCFGYYMVLTGKADLMLDLDLKDCDILPLIPIMKAAGLSVIMLQPESYTDIIVCKPELRKKVEKIFF